jgi:hypothetical protein
MRAGFALRLSAAGLPAIALSLALAAATAPSPAMAQEGSLTGGIMTLLGITAPQGPEIEYRERPPLVVPPRSTLPSPQEREEARARANWPNDPDRERRRAARADDNIPATEREKYRLNQGSGRLSGRELAAGRGGTGGGPRMAAPSDNSPDELYWTPMRQMREADARRAAQQVERPLGEEPPRRYLTEPPRGFRAATERVRPTQEPVIRNEGTGQIEFATGRPVPN